VGELDAYCRFLIEQRVTPSLAILAARGEEVLIKRAYNQDDAIYDLASLTKPCLTAISLMLLTMDGLLDPDQFMADMMPGTHPELRLHHLAAHCAAMPDWYPYYLFPEPLGQQLETHLRAAFPSRQVIYSCPGYSLLKKIWEWVIAPTSIANWIQGRIFSPLGLKDTFLGGDPRYVGSTQVMPTEAGNVYELQLAIQRGFTDRFGSFNWYEPISPGVTHDLNARHQGGFGGNAGLFSTASELLVLMNQCDPDTTQLFKGREELCRWFWKNLTPWSPAHRTFGFKRNSSFSAAAGSALSRKAIGHHGFTGCSAWMEPKGGLRLIVLSNRIHPRVDESVNFNRIRRRLFRLMVKEIG